jgi:hypothetical protein
MNATSCSNHDEGPDDVDEERRREKGHQAQQCHGAQGKRHHRVRSVGDEGTRQFLYPSIAFLRLERPGGAEVSDDDTAPHVLQDSGMCARHKTCLNELQANADDGEGGRHPEQGAHRERQPAEGAHLE